MNKAEAMEYLRKYPVFWSRLGLSYDPPLFDVAGTPLALDLNFEDYLRTHDAFSDAGVKIHTCILSNGWVGVDRYDYTWTDKVLESIFASGKTEYFIPRIKLNVPIDWCRENPTEVFVYEEGPRSAEEIRGLVGTLKHDYLGYEIATGLYTAGAWQDPRPNVGGVIARQSFSSDKWLQDAGEALRRLVLHLEQSPWGDKILGYHIAYGTSGESMFWGRQSAKFGDYGITNQAKFHAWALKKYGSEEALRQAWGPEYQDEVIPPPQLRERVCAASDDFYRDDVADRWSLDYDEFNCEVNTDALMYFGNIVKQNTDDKLVGAFYGYLLHVGRSAYTGFLGWKRLLQSDCVDFFAAPKSYFRSAPGEPGGVMAPTVSINRTRLWVDECDNRTHLALGNDFGKASCAEETYTVLLRELCKNISHNSGLWYMDLGKGWYDDEGIMAHIDALMKASATVRQKEHRSVAQITVIVDEESILYTHPSVTRPIENLLRELQLTGAPIDIIFSHDIGEVDLSGIRLAVLLTPFCMDDDCIASLRAQLPGETHILYCGKTKADNGAVLLEIPGKKMPAYTIKPAEDMLPLCSNEEGVVIAQNSCGDFILSTPDVGVAELRKIVERARVHCYAPAGCAVYADNRILSFFPARGMTFEPSLPENMHLTELLTKDAYQAGEPMHLEAKRGIAFLAE